MRQSPPSHHRRFKPVLWLLPLVFIVLIYSNTFRASWHLDDFSNIVTNPRIQMESITWQGLSDAFHGGPRGQAWRPVAFVSFALNWAIGGSDVIGYHLVNLLIHVLCAILLFFTLRLLFQTPALRESSREKVYFTALLSALLWAAHPIQTQAVTYIVQRMAQFAALFYLAGMYSYLKGRLAESKRGKIVWFTAVAGSFLLAMGSKQNSITFPLALVLLEIVFFQSLQEFGKDHKFRLGVLAAAAMAAILAGLVFLSANPLQILEMYQGMAVTPMQRLLTETRVLVFHLFQILLPLPSQFSIDHHFELSMGLFDPWTTFAATVMIAALVVTGIACRRKYPLLGFAILFFFLTHLVESSIVPLQLVFEHRNYLPTLFFFPPIASGVYTAIQRYRSQRAGADVLAAIFLGFLLCTLGYATYTRNSVWLTEKSLWTDAHFKAPEMSRPLHNLAWGHYEQIGQYQKAMSLYMQALDKKTHRKYERAVTYSNIAGIYFDYGYYEEAVQYWQKALSILPHYSEYRFRLALALSKQQKWDPAMAEVEKILKKSPQNANYRILKGRVLLYQNRPEEALEQFRHALRGHPRDAATSIHCGMALEALGAPENAAVVYRYALSLNPASLETRMRLAAAYISAGSIGQSEALIREIVDAYRFSEIQTNWQRLLSAPVPKPDDYRRMARRISDRMQYEGKRLVDAEIFDSKKHTDQEDGAAN